MRGELSAEGGEWKDGFLRPCAAGVVLCIVARPSPSRCFPCRSTIANPWIFATNLGFAWYRPLGDRTAAQLRLRRAATAGGRQALGAVVQRAVPHRAATGRSSISCRATRRALGEVGWAPGVAMGHCFVISFFLTAKGGSPSGNGRIGAGRRMSPERSESALRGAGAERPKTVRAPGLLPAPLPT